MRTLAPVDYYMNSFYYGAYRDSASKWLDKSIEMEKQADIYETVHREWNKDN